MKKISRAMLFGSLLLGTISIHAAVNTFRAKKCSIPHFQKRLRCTPQEIEAGKKWLKKVTLRTAFVELASLIAGGVKYAELKQAKAQAQQVPGPSAQPQQQLSDYDRFVIQTFKDNDPVQLANLAQQLKNYENLEKVTFAGAQQAANAAQGKAQNLANKLLKYEIIKDVFPEVAVRNFIATARTFSKPGAFN